MKNLYKLIIILLISNLSFSQTYIPMPAGYNEGKPFYSHNGFLYCQSTLVSNPTGQVYLFKVNELNNIVTPINNSNSIGVESINTSNFQVYNNEIYCGLYGGVLRICPTLNTVKLITGIGYEFAVLNNKIFGTSGVYDLISQTYTNLMDPENPLQVMLNLEGFKLYNNSIFCTRTIVNGPSTNQYESKIYRIFDYNSVQLLYTNPLNGLYQGFDDNKAVLFNNKLLYRFQKFINNVSTTSVESYDLDNNSINTIFTYAPSFILNSHYVFNNNIYFNNGSNQTLVSNGISLATLTNIPTVCNIGSAGFVFNTDSPTFGSSQQRNNSILLNNNIFGCTSRYDGSIPSNIYEIRKSNGTLNGTSLIYSSTSAQLHSAITINNSIYFFKYTAQGLFGELIRYNDLNQQVLNVLNGALYSNLFKVNNSIFFEGTLNGLSGLHKIDTATLSNDIFEENLKFSISPNPANSSLTITTQETLKSINIIDFLGRKTNITNFENNTIDVSNLQNGVYFLEISTENGSQTIKFIKN